MSDTTLTSKNDRQTKLLQYFLLGSTIPFREGGGVVFPHGFPGVGYRLDESQYDRYKAGLERTILGSEGHRRARHARWIALVGMLGLLVFFAAMNFIQKSPFYESELDLLVPAVGLALLIAAVFACLFYIQRRATQFSREFESAPRLSRLAYLQERWLGTLVAQNAGVISLHLKVVLPLVIAIYSIQAELTPFRTLLILLILVLPLVVYAAYRLSLLFVFWRFRLRNGRAPTPADLAPL